MKLPHGVIEHDVPIPTSTRGYPWREMRVGDSMFFSKRDDTDVRMLVWKAGKRLGFKFTVRKVEGGHRVWRIG